MQTSLIKGLVLTCGKVKREYKHEEDPNARLKKHCCHKSLEKKEKSILHIVTLNCKVNKCSPDFLENSFPIKMF